MLSAAAQVMTRTSLTPGFVSPRLLCTAGPQPLVFRCDHIPSIVSFVCRGARRAEVVQPGPEEAQELLQSAWLPGGRQPGSSQWCPLIQKGGGGHKQTQEIRSEHKKMLFYCASGQTWVQVARGGCGSPSRETPALQPGVAGPVCGGMGSSWGWLS